MTTVIDLDTATPEQLREHYNELRKADPAHQHPKKMLMLLGGCRQRAHGEQHYAGNLGGNPEKIIFSDQEAIEFLQTQYKNGDRRRWWLIEINHIGEGTADSFTIDRS